MTPHQYRALLRRQGLTLSATARLFNVADKTPRRWKQDGIEGPAAILLRLLDDGKVSVADVEEARDKG